MYQPKFARLFTLVAIMMLMPPIGGASALAADDVDNLNRQVVQLYDQGNYKQATVIAEKALTLAEQTLGIDHPTTLSIASNLAVSYQAQGRYGDAEPLLMRVLAAHERASGPEHPDTLRSVNNLGFSSQQQGRYGEAEALYRRALAGYERAYGPDHADTLREVSNLGTLYQDLGRNSEAEPLLKRTVAGYERIYGPEHPDTLRSVNNLGFLYQREGRYEEAGRLYARALAGYERALGPVHPDTVRSVGNLGTLYQDQGRYEEAEPLYRRALASYEGALGPDHPDTARSVNNLGFLYQQQGRYAEAEPLLKRAVASYERALGAEHPETLQSVGNLGHLYQLQGRYDEAEPLYQRALTGRERNLGTEHPDTMQSLNNLGFLYDEQGRNEEAEPLYRRAVAGYEHALGPDHPQTLRSVNNLGLLYVKRRRFEEAAPLLKRAFVGMERTLGPEHPDTLLSMGNLGELYFIQLDWQRSAELWRRSTAAITARVQRGTPLGAPSVTGKKKSDAEQLSGQFWGIVKALSRLDVGAFWDAATLRETFRASQWALSSDVAESLAQMATRGAKGDGALAELVRERQDLAAQWQQRELLRNAALGQETAKRDAAAEADNAARMTAIDIRLAEIDKKLAASFPDYTALASSAPLTVEEVQTQLDANEALVLFLDTPKRQPTPDETFIWVVTKRDARWVRANLGTQGLATEVQALRCGLDYTAWQGKRCKEQAREPYALADYRGGKPLPFDHARAYQLYKTLFGKIEDVIKGKQLILVPSGPLTQLPFQVLITAPPKTADHRDMAWLSREHAVTVLPAVSSLKALRRIVRPSAAPKPLIGFGNPLLTGNDSVGKQLAERARAKQSCPKTAWERVATLFAAPDATAPLQARGRLADTTLIRQQSPLPETADELCAVARAIGADPADIRLGASATEREVKAASERGDLAKYRIVHFATHGVMAGQLSLDSEPGLILTPPAEASAEDDGYLTASEIAALKLDADWVILSACNTAAGEAVSAEALSGLARAFIYAQARALLVSHWEVDSEATVKLITAAMREIARDKTAGRAEALRRAMIVLIDKSDPRDAHPANWAPFIVVGEGAR